MKKAEVLQVALDILNRAEELNMSNYSHDQVRVLNDIYVEVYLFIEEALKKEKSYASQKADNGYFNPSHHITYRKQEQELQYPKMEKLGVNINAQTFEQCVNSLISMIEDNQKAEVSKENVCRFVKDYYNLPESGVQTLNIDSLIHCLETFSSQFPNQNDDVQADNDESMRILSEAFISEKFKGMDSEAWNSEKNYDIKIFEIGFKSAMALKRPESKPQISEEAIEELWYEYAINSYNDGSVIPNLTIMHMGYFQFLKAIESLSMPKTNVITEDEIEKAAKDYEDRTHEGPVSRWAINDFKAGAKWALSLSMPSDFAEFCEWCDEYLGYRAKDSDGDWSWFHFEGIFKNLAEVYDFWTREVKQTKS